MSAIKYLKQFKAYMQKTEVRCESNVFRLHYQFTVILLLGSSVLLTAGEYFGSPIKCITELPKNVINTYCWIKSTFTIQDYSARHAAGLHPLPGIIAPKTEEDIPDDEQEWRFHNYYQWVVFFLLFQAGFCYLPKYIWSCLEGGLVKALATGFSKGLFADVHSKKKDVIDYIVKHIRLHNSYVFKYWFCEFLCFANIVVQLFIIDWFLGGDFLTYGPRWIDYVDKDQSERVDPMIYVFPRMTKCHFRKFGASGTIELRDSYCLLPLNIFNEKVFLFMWFWYVCLAVLLGVLVLYRIALFTIPSLRPRALRNQSKGVDMETIQSLLNKISIGDWWLLYILASNIDPGTYQDIISELAKEIQEPVKCNNGYNSAGGNHFCSSSV